MLASAGRIDKNYRHGILVAGWVVSLGLADRQASVLNDIDRFCDQALGESSIYSLLHRERDGLFPDEMFAYTGVFRPASRTQAPRTAGPRFVSGGITSPPWDSNSGRQTLGYCAGGAPRRLGLHPESQTGLPFFSSPYRRWSGAFDRRWAKDFARTWQGL